MGWWMVKMVVGRVLWCKRIRAGRWALIVASRGVVMLYVDAYKILDRYFRDECEDTCGISMLNIQAHVMSSSTLVRIWHLSAARCKDRWKWLKEENTTKLLLLPNLGTT